MAVVEMQKLSISGLKKNRKATLELLQSLGAMEIRTDRLPEKGLAHQDTASQSAQFLRESDVLDDAIGILTKYADEKKGFLASLAGKAEVSREEYEKTVANRGGIMNDARKVCQKEKEIGECRASIVKDENLIAANEPWKTLGVPLNFTGTKTTAAFIGTLTGNYDAAYVTQKLNEAVPDGRVDADVLFHEGEMTCISAICLKKDEEKALEALRALGYARPANASDLIPAEASKACAEDIEVQKARIETLTKEIVSMGDRKDDFRILSDYFRTRAEKYRLLGTIPQSERAFFLEGWVEKAKADQIASLLEEKCGVVVSREKRRKKEAEPVILKNNRFSQSAEGVLESYGLPKHGHVDPTFVMSIFYVIFFGMMLSDGAYGLIMAIGSFIILRKFKKMSAGLQKMFRLFFWCGLSTAFWGFMYGGFFGDAIDVIATTFFGYTGPTPILKPLWFEPLGDPMRLLIYCMLFGIIHLFFGLGMKGYELLKKKDVVGFVSDILSWYLFLIGLILMLLPTSIFASISQMTIVFPAWLNLLAKILAIAGALIILVMSGRRKKNKWALRIALGAYDLYGVTSWLSDVLSYSRLLALGLATGVIASVINMMASMFGNGVLGVIIFIVVFILGHTLNLAINALGAYVHTNRLQYVEFFGKFFDAGGESFTPFESKNKYIEIKEEKMS